MNLMVEKENPNSNNVNRGFGFVEFYNNAAAEQARRKLSSSEYR
jgi:RNA recognition motif-containing protein